ncbi:MAG TPA: histidine kinase [Nakamurella sp.]
MTASATAGMQRESGRADPARPWAVTALIWAGGLGFAAAIVTDVLIADGTTAGSLIWICVGVLPVYLVAVWLAGRRPDHPQTRRLLILAATFAAGVLTENAVAAWYVGPSSDGWLFWVNVVGGVLGMLGTSVSLLLFATYPDGHVELWWQRILVRGLWVLPVLPVLWMLTNPAVPLDTYLAVSAPAAPTTLPSPLFIPALAPLGPVLLVLNDPVLIGIGAIGLLFYRFLTAPAQQRRRMRLLTYTLVAGSPILITLLVLRALGANDDDVAIKVLSAFFLPFMLAIPVSIVIGVLRYRLYDIDVIVRRSVVYGALTFGIALAYIGLAVAPGLALGDQIPVQLAVVLTILAAIAFHPLRRRLEHLADRWVFGERVNRYRLLTEFGAGLEHTIAVPDLLPRLARTVQDGLSAPWVRVSVSGVPDAVAGPAGGEVGLAVPMESRRLPGAVSADRPEGDVSDGDIPGPPGRLELGRIECGARPDGYDEQDRELLATLAGQAAAAIANVRLSAELAERLAELDRSRARIVTAADAERRRIERDIHDGVQQQVVALMMKIRLARNQVGRGDRSADDALAELGVDILDLLADLRELAHGIHPPVLSDGGLVAAVEARTARLPFTVRVSAGPGLREHRFADDVEGAAYYVVCEALTNVAKHAGGTDTEVGLTNGSGELAVVVTDRGRGFVTAGRHGAGLTNLKDRVEALGGRFTVASAPGRGTSVSAHLPVGPVHA